jgi:putative hydrolase of the HAD superfamily
MKTIFLFDWGNTVMKDFPDQSGPMWTWDRVEMMPGTDKMLINFASSADCYIATNAKDSDKEDILRALRRVDLDVYFKDIFCYRELNVAKPSKAYFDAITIRLNADKKEMLMIGDNLRTDVLGAIENGIDAILYDPENLNVDYNGLKIVNWSELPDCLKYL